MLVGARRGILSSKWRNPNRYLTQNQATGTDASSNTTGFTGLKGDETLSSSTDYAHNGYRSLKCVTTGLHTTEGVYNNLTVSALTNYTFGTWIIAPPNQTMRLTIGDWDNNNINYDFIGSGVWQQIETSLTTDATTTLYWDIVTRGTAAAITMYLDDLYLV